MQLRARHPPAKGLGHLDPRQILFRLLGRVDRLAHTPRRPLRSSEQDLRQRAVEIVPAQRRIAAHRLHFEDAFLQLQH